MQIVIFAKQFLHKQFFHFLNGSQKVKLGKFKKGLFSQYPFTVWFQIPLFCIPLVYVYCVIVYPLTQVYLGEVKKHFPHINNNCYKSQCYVGIFCRCNNFWILQNLEPWSNFLHCAWQRINWAEGAKVTFNVSWEGVVCQSQTHFLPRLPR